MGAPIIKRVGLTAIVWFLWAQTQWIARRLQRSTAVAFGWASIFTLLAVLAAGAAATLIAVAL